MTIVATVARIVVGLIFLAAGAMTFLFVFGTAQVILVVLVILVLRRVGL